MLSTILPYYNDTLAEQANEFHASLFEGGEHSTSMVNTYYIALSGKSTIVEMSYSDGIWNDIGTEDGDGTVPIWSASLADMYPESTFYINGKEHEKLDHTGLVSNEEVLKFVNNLIEGSTSLDEFSIITAD